MADITVATHSGDFHPDDVFAVATLRLLHGDSLKVVRTRAPEVYEKADIVVDVGGEHDPERNRFDHHQEGGAGQRENTIPYASFGLVWKKYGEQLCGSAEVARTIEQKIVMPIDAMDSGVSVFLPVFKDVDPYTYDNVIFSFRPTWKEKTDLTEAFLEAVELTQTVLSREIQKAKDNAEGAEFVEEAYQKAEDKRIIVLDAHYPWHDVVASHPEPLFAVYPAENSWHVKSVWKGVVRFENRKNFPAAWAGKKDAELAAITGVADAVFCHNKLFIAVARSKEGAIQLARIAVHS